MACVAAAWLGVGDTMGQDDGIRDVPAEKATLSWKGQMTSPRDPINAYFMDSRSLTAHTFLATLRPNIGSVVLCRSSHGRSVPYAEVPTVIVA